MSGGNTAIFFSIFVKMLKKEKQSWSWLEIGWRFGFDFTV
jgi:hypothetical protein